MRAATWSIKAKFTSESVVGNYTVRVQVSDEVASSSREADLIRDGLVIDAYTVDMAAEKLYVHMIYAYDETPVENGVIGFGGLLTASTNSTGWAVFNLSAAPEFSWNQTVYGVQDELYGITYKMMNQSVPLAKIGSRLVFSDAEVTGLSWDGVNLYITAEAGTVEVSGSRPTYIINATYNLNVGYTDYLSLTHDGSRRIVVAYPNWGDLYIRGLSAGVLIDVFWEGQTLTLVLEGENGTTGNIAIYCGSRGMPRGWSGFDVNPEYNAETTVLIGRYTFASSQVVLTLDFAMPVSSGGGSFTPKVSLMIGVVKPVSLHPGETLTAFLCVNWTGASILKVTSIEFSGSAKDWLTLAESLPKLFTKQVGEYVGRGEIKVRITAPEGAQPGEYAVPVAIRAEAVGSRLEANGYLTFKVAPTAGPLSLVPEYMTLIFVAALLLIILYAYLKD